MKPPPPLTRRRWAWTLAALFALALGSAALGVALGPGEAFVRLLHGEASPLDLRVLRDLRLVRVLAGLMAGGALACAGAVLQAIFRNPLADPFVLGTSGGAAFGAVAGIVLLEDSTLAGGWGEWLRGMDLVSIPFLAFLGALLAIGVVSTGATGRGALPTQSLLLIGVIANYVFTALVLFLTVMADPKKLPRIEAWLLGDLSGGRFGLAGSAIALAICVGICTAMCVVLSRDLDALTLGDEQAAALGVPVARVRWTAFLLSSLATAIAVSFSGIVGFVGLVLPHGLRRLVGADHRLLLPASFLGGGALLVLADVPARMLFSPVELPVGVVTAIFGGPLFYWILRRRSA
ncbi:MAG: iron ABC transporter permease [Planctomycetes bacterium]|nr:iron ABC transporter permease [Planctomycetota bacterium]